MKSLTDLLSDREYVGRLIVVGMNPVHERVVLYGMQGSSPPSQARRILPEDHKLVVVPHDMKTLQQGNPELLIYDAVTWNDGPNVNVVVSNGRQTNELTRQPNDKPAWKVLLDSLQAWSYEPDSCYTARVSACLRGSEFATSIIRKHMNRPLHTYDTYGFREGQGRFFSTYNGPNTNPPPTFDGQPIEVYVPWLEPGDAVRALYDALGVNDVRSTDIRIAVAAAFFGNNGVRLSIKNRHEVQE
jgi:IMP cyclohydrolase